MAMVMAMPVQAFIDAVFRSNLGIT